MEHVYEYVQIQVLFECTLRNTTSLTLVMILNLTQFGLASIYPKNNIRVTRLGEIWYNAFFWFYSHKSSAMGKTPPLPMNNLAMWLMGLGARGCRGTQVESDLFAFPL